MPALRGLSERRLNMRPYAALPFCIGLLAVPSFAAEQPNPKGGGHPAVAPKPPKQAQVKPPAAPKGQGQGRAGGAPQDPVDRFMKMTPDQREKALSKLPPQRRENIERRLNDLQKLPPAARTRMMNRVEILNSLPVERQQQVRQALRRFQQMPEERHAVIQTEMQNMEPLNDEQRRERMNSEEFRNRYTPAEQQMMRNMLEVVP